MPFGNAFECVSASAPLTLTGAVGKVGLLSRPLSGSGANGGARRNAAAKQARIISLFLCGKKQLSYRKHFLCVKAKILHPQVPVDRCENASVSKLVRAEPAREAECVRKMCCTGRSCDANRMRKKPSFSSTPAGRSSFYQQEKKKRGLPKRSSA